MKTLQNKGFTLVELIVVITILAILGTIAFISLQGYSTDAKNSKVTSDLKTISTALEAKRTQTSETLDAFLAGAHITANEVAGDTWSGITLVANTNYAVSNMNFPVLGQNGAEFKDPNSANAEYLYAYATVVGHSGYQLVGQIIENDVKAARVVGNYYEKLAADVDGLVSPNGATTQLTNGLAIPSPATNLY